MHTRRVLQQITGRHHPLLKRLRAMARSGVVLDGGDVLLETPTLVQDALASGTRIHTALIRSGAGALTRDYLKDLPADATCFEVEPRLFASLTSTETSAGILALARAPSWQPADLFRSEKPLILVVARLLDPGNLGTILRTAEAFGVTGIILTKGTVSPFNAKAFRAAAGSALRLPALLDCSSQEIISLLEQRKIPLLVAVPHVGRPLAETELGGPVALALGSEGAGLPQELSRAGTPVSIPMGGRVESLNVAIAAAVLLYEIALQRGAARAGQECGR